MLEADTDAADATGGGLEAPPSLRARTTAKPARDAARWVRDLVAEHHDFIWRSLRRLGVPEGEVDDATQRVFCVALRRADDVFAGKERSFLFGTAMHVAADVRRARARAREVLDEEALEQTEHPASNPEELTDQKRARQMLDHVLDAMSVELRTVFVLVELEELTAPEIATLLDVPLGTVASRLRRSREEFRAIVVRLRRSRSGHAGPAGTPKNTSGVMR